MATSNDFSARLERDIEPLTTLDSRGYQQPDSGLDSYLMKLKKRNSKMEVETQAKTDNTNKAIFALSPKLSVMNSMDEDMIRESSQD